MSMGHLKASSNQSHSRQELDPKEENCRQNEGKERGGTRKAVIALDGVQKRK
jgi:hypothetical protein